MSKLDELIEKLCANGVKYEKLGDIGKVCMCKRIMKHQTTPSGDVPFYKIGTFGGNADAYISNELFEEYSTTYSYPKKNEILISCSGTIGRTVIFNGEKSYFQDSNIVWIRNDEKKVLNKFLYYYYQTFPWKIYDGGVIKRLYNNIIEQTLVPVPPLEVQCEIVHILDNFTLLSALLSAELSAELKARQKQYEYYRDELIKNSKAKEGKLIELLSQPITDGPHTTPKLFSTGVPFVSATAVYNGKVHLEDAKGYISKEFDNECAKKYKPKKNDVYMVKSGSTTGKVAYVDFDDDFNIWSPLAAMRTENEITSRYLYHLLQTKDIQNQVLTKMSHGSQPNLSMRVIEQFDVKIPEIEEQERIVNILDRFDKLCNDISVGLPAEIEARKKQYEYYRDKLLNFKELKVE